MTATASRRLREGVDFFPLTVDVEERTYAVGRIPGSFFRREGRATEKATLTARLIDRPLRPNFKPMATATTRMSLRPIIAADLVQPARHHRPEWRIGRTDVSAPFRSTVRSVRSVSPSSMAEWVPFPTYEQGEEAVFEIVVAGKRNGPGWHRHRHGRGRCIRGWLSAWSRTALRRRMKPPWPQASRQRRTTSQR